MNKGPFTLCSIFTTDTTVRPHTCKGFFVILIDLQRVTVLS